MNEFLLNFGERECAECAKKNARKINSEMDFPTNGGRALGRIDFPVKERSNGSQAI